MYHSCAEAIRQNDCRRKTDCSEGAESGLSMGQSILKREVSKDRKGQVQGIGMGGSRSSGSIWAQPVCVWQNVMPVLR